VARANETPYPYDMMLAGEGYMLAKGPAGEPAYSEEKLEFFPPRQSASDASYANFPPEAEATWAVPDFAGGYGQPRETDGLTNRYYYGLGVDCRIPGQVTLAPEVKTAATSGTGTLVGSFELGTTLYVAAGRYCLSSTDGDSWSVSKDFGAGNTAAAAAVFQGTSGTTYAFVAMASGSGDPAYWLYDGSTWVQDGTLNKADRFAVVGDELWRGYDGNKVAKSSNGGTSATWASAITVGDADSAITGLLVLDNRLYITKEDGLFTLTDDATQIDQDLLPELHGRKDAGNGVGSTVWRNEAWIPFRQGFYRYTPGSISPVGPEVETGNTSPVRGRITAAAGDDYFLYAALQNESGNSYLMSFGGAATAATGAIAAWHPLADLGGVDCRHMFVSSIPGTNPRLYFGRDEDIGYIVLPRSSPNPTLDSNCRFATSGSLYLSRYDARFPAQDKAYLACSILGIDLDGNNEYVDVYYKAAGAGSYSLLGRYDTDPGSRQEFAATVAGKYLDLRLDLVSSGSTATPKCTSLALAYAVRTDYKRQFQFFVRAADRAPLLSGQRSAKSAADTASGIEAAVGAQGAVTLVAPDGNSYEVLVIDAARHATRAEADRPLEFSIPVTAVEYRTTASRGTWDRAGVHAWDQLAAWTWTQTTDL
jgi:hypothetical protein